MSSTLVQIFYPLIRFIEVIRLDITVPRLMRKQYKYDTRG